MRVLVDTNVIVDVLQRREPMFSYGREIFLAVAAKRIEGLITAKQAADIHSLRTSSSRGRNMLMRKPALL